MSATDLTRDAVRVEGTIDSPEDSAATAASLVRYRFKVFPVHVFEEVTATGEVVRRKKPIVSSWPEAAEAADAAVIFDWWQAATFAWPGISMGGSDVVALDVDRKGGKDGFASLAAEGLTPPLTLMYRTLTGDGRHFLYRAPAGSWTNGADILGPSGRPMPGVDVRAGRGFVVYYGSRLTEAPQLAEAPSFALLPSRDRTGRSDISVAAWRTALTPGPMSHSVQEALLRVKPSGMSHYDMLQATAALVRCGSSGAPGAAEALDQGREVYTAAWPTFAKKWDDAVAGSVRHFGMPSDPFHSLILDEGQTARSGPWSPSRFEALDAFDSSDRGGPRLNPVKLRGVVNPDDDLALGVDQQVWRYEDGRYLQDDEVTTRRTVQVLRDLYRRDASPLARDMVIHAPAFPRLTDSPPDPGLINVRNGMVDWRTGELLPHSPTYRSTVQLPVAFDPEATCPRFDAWLDQVLEPELLPVAWEVIAYTVMSGNPFQQAALLLGQPHSGKGTLLRVVQRLVGDENVAHVTVKGMGEKFPPATLYGRLVNIVGDAEADFLKDTAAFKRIVGGDRISAENKGKALFSFTPWAFHLFAANHLPKSSDASGGWLRRWLVLPFKGTVAKDEGFHEDDLHAEAEGIFARAVGVLPDLVQRKRFTETMSMAEPLRELAQLSDPALLWLTEDDRVARDPGDQNMREARADVYRRYEQWARENGHTRPLSSTSLYKSLEALGHQVKVVRGTRYFVGLRITPAPNYMHPGGLDQATGGVAEAGGWLS